MARFVCPSREQNVPPIYLATSKGLPYDYVLGPRDNQRLSAERRLEHDVRVDTGAVDRLLSRLDDA